MNKKELIAEAKRRYPIGTVFIALTEDEKPYTVKEFSSSEGGNGWYTDEHIIIYVEGVTGSGKYVYRKGQWADIVSYPDGCVPEGTINNSFPIY